MVKCRLPNMKFMSAPVGNGRSTPIDTSTVSVSDIDRMLGTSPKVSVSTLACQTHESTLEELVLRDILGPIILLTRQHEVRVALELLEHICSSGLATQVLPFGRSAHREVLRSFMRTEGPRLGLSSKVAIINAMGGHHIDEGVCNLNSRNEGLVSDSSAAVLASPKADARAARSVGINLSDEVIRRPTSAQSRTPPFRRRSLKTARKSSAFSSQNAVVSDPLAEVGQLEKKAECDQSAFTDEAWPLMTGRSDERTFDIDELEMERSQPSSGSPQEEMISNLYGYPS
eukprot:TRINITY_DN16437_c0_g1_i1.p1 TRINITY_DN16437_c0_g1~~TRINITY_DN16437_c0_g1_i1.p1  ORF type:complete len:303 (-),score=22.42 TRINITY_DN16437_c0_g1_i1:12-869(-)